MAKKGNTAPVNPIPPFPPRSMEEINKEYSNLCAKYGEAQYMKALNESKMRGMEQKLFELQKEAGERQKLDSEAKPEVDHAAEEASNG